MIRKFTVEGFKSLERLELGLGRVTVLIGENGSGKSNILEAIALLGAAAADKLDNEFLVNRGIRVTDAPLMVSEFRDGKAPSDEGVRNVTLSATSEEKGSLTLELSPLTDRWSATVDPGRKFEVTVVKKEPEEVETDAPIVESLKDFAKLAPKPKVEVKDGEVSITLGPVRASEKAAGEITKSISEGLVDKLKTTFGKMHLASAEKKLSCARFLIYGPENSALRRFEDEGQIQPVGIRGEGLFKMLQAFASNDQADRLLELKRSLELVGWFFDFSIPADLAPGENRLRICDRYVKPTMAFDQRSANEGFLFLIFYFAVLLSEATPPFFAIDNIDTSLNPKLCAELMRRICQLAKNYNKQIIVTTHNPAILDGLNLTDDDQRLYIVFRNSEGRTRTRRVKAPRPRPGKTPIKLSDAFLRGLVAEGATDHAVLQNILLGFFQEQNLESGDITPTQPLLDETGKQLADSFGGWQQVLKWLEERRYDEAFQFNDYVVVQIDTDFCDKEGFDVPKIVDGSTRTPEQLVTAVRERLFEIIGPTDLNAYTGRFFCAVAVHHVECWLLPLWGKLTELDGTHTCKQRVDNGLGRAKEPGLHKDRVETYSNASRHFRKRKHLLEAAASQRSLQLFCESLGGVPTGP
jgi:predicted ATPase